MKISLTPHLDYAEECFRNAHIVQPEHWKDNWMKAMWLHLLWAAEGRELAVIAGVQAVDPPPTRFRPCPHCDAPPGTEHAQSCPTRGVDLPHGGQQK